MRNRGYRRYREALIRKRLIAEAIRRYNRKSIGFRWDGSYKPRVHSAADLPKTGHYRIGRILRNDGGGRADEHACGYCERCIDDNLRNYRRRCAAQDADWIAWMRGDHYSDVEDVPEETGSAVADFIVS